LDALHKAVFTNASSQANVRQIRGRMDGVMSDAAPKERGGSTQLSVRGWTRTKAARNPHGGGIESLIAFLEKRATPSNPNAAANQRVKISKVCGTSPSGGHRHIRSIDLPGLFSPQADIPERRLGLPRVVATSVG
jgi:nuclear RNA export factor